MEASKQLSRFSTREQKLRSQSTPIQGQKIEKKTKSKGALRRKSGCHEYYRRESIEASKQLSHFSTREQKPRSQSTPIPGLLIQRNKKQRSTLSKIRLSSTILSKRINRIIQTTLPISDTSTEAKKR